MEQAGEAVRRSRTGWLITGGVAVVLCLLVAYGLRGPSPIQKGIAPHFTLPLLDGGEVRLAELRGRVVVINFWASWCQPCRDEAPTLERVWQAYQGREVAFIGVVFKDVERQAHDFIARYGLTYPNGLDRRSRIAGAYAVTGIPETFVVAPDGRIAAHFIGGVTEEQLNAALDEALPRQ